MIGLQFAVELDSFAIAAKVESVETLLLESTTVIVHNLSVGRTCVVCNMIMAVSTSKTHK